MVPPYKVQMTTDSNGASFVAFGAEITNKGPGILKVVGQRIPGGLMDAKQLLLTTNDLKTAVTDSTVQHVGNLQYSPSPSHHHWHFLHFENYELLSMPNLDFVAPTRKTGFCLSGLNQGFYCASSNPAATEIGWSENGGVPQPNTTAMGIMPAGAPMTPNQSSSDDYDPTIEGQDIEITNVPNGRYCLSFTVNPDNKLVETNYGDNGSSAPIDVGGTPGGRRTLSQPVDSQGDVITFSNSSTCGSTKPVVKPLTKRIAASLTKRALRTRLRKAPSGVTGTCRLRGKSKAICNVTFRSAKAPYRGSVTITQKVLAGQVRWYYHIDVKRTGRGSCTAAGTCPTRVRTKTVYGGVLGGATKAAARIQAASYGERRAPVRQGAAWPAWYLLKLNSTPTPLEPLPLPPLGG